MPFISKAFAVKRVLTVLVADIFDILLCCVKFYVKFCLFLIIIIYICESYH